MTTPSSAAASLGEAIRLAQQRYLESEDAPSAFQALLDGLLRETQSEYGFIGEIERDPEGLPYLRTHAITNIAWNDEMRALLQRSTEGMIFRRLDSLFGAVMVTQAPVVANDPGNDPRRAGLPPGHPPMRAFLGLPFKFGEEMVGMVGVANRPGGYDEAIAEALVPLLATCGTLIAAWRAARVRRAVERSLAESERRFRELADHSEEVFWISTTDKNTMDYISPAFERIWQIPRSALLEQPRAWLDAVHPDDRQRVLEAATTRQTTGAYNERYRIIRPDGEVRWVQDRATPVHDERGVAVRIVGTARDVTAEVMAAARERRALEQLRGLARHLGDAEARVRRDVGRVLHEDIQQQLAAVKIRLDLPPDCARAHAMEAIAGAQLLIDECISATRRLSHHVRPPILTARRVDLALAWLADWARTAHGLQVTVSCPEIELVSTTTLEILAFGARELLFNVAKHAGVHEARLEATMDSGVLEVLVEDGGHGSALRPEDAKGFGLADIRERLAVVAGQLTIDTSPGQGLRARMRIPLEDGRVADGGAARSSDAAEAAPLRIRVLIADDHALIREGLILRLRRDPLVHIVGEAVDGVEAIEMAQRLRPDVVLMDLSMPRINGVDATRRIRASVPETRIIGLSMHDASAMAEAMLAAGASRYVNKVDADQILEVIKRVVSER